MLLRKKKYQENLLQTLDGQLETLEKMTTDLEFAQIELQVLDGLKTGNAALAKVHQLLTVDEVERVLDETREAVDKQQEIDALLNGVLSGDDEADVMGELDALVAEEQRLADADAGRGAEEEKATAGESIGDRLPDVPTDELPAKAAEEDGDKEEENTEVARKREKQRVRPQKQALEA